MLNSHRIWDLDFCRAIDKLSSEKCGVSSSTLMNNAGKSAANWLLQNFKDYEFLFLIGEGNNGGDGLIAIKYLEQAKQKIYVCHSKTFQKGLLSSYSSPKLIIVDCLLGIGTNRELSPGNIFSCLQEASTLTKHAVVAFDLPSGLFCDRTDQVSLPLSANFTLTFGGKKPSLLVTPSRDLCGKIICLDIGFPEKAQTMAADKYPAFLREVDPSSFLKTSPWSSLPASANKFDRGHVLIIGGSDGKTGAPILAGLAALKCGAGWSTVAIPPVFHRAQNKEFPLELTFEDLFDKGSDNLDLEKIENFLFERKVKSLLIGPGWTDNLLDEKSFKVLVKFMENGGKVILDAGALQGILQLLEKVSSDKNLYLTPHPGEWRKMGMLPDPDKKESIQSLLKFANVRKLNFTYKSATPFFFCAGQDAAYMMTEGSNILSKAGSGDIFAGLLAAHCAISNDALLNFSRSYHILCEASKLAADGLLGGDGVIATDIIAKL